MGRDDRQISVVIYRVVSIVLSRLDVGLRRLDSLPWDRFPVRFLKPVVAVFAWALAFAFVGGRVLEWLVLAAILFVFTPTVYRATLGLPADGYGFRLLCTVLGLAYALLFWNPTTVVGFASSAVLLAVVSAASLLGYLKYFAGWRLRNLEGPAATVLDAFLPAADVVEQQRRDRSRGQYYRRTSETLWVAALGVIVAFPCFLGGLSVTFLRRVSPLADLVLLGWFVYEAVAARNGTAVIPFDFEPRIYRGMANATRNLEGLTLVVFAVVGLALSVIPLTEAMAVAWVIATSAPASLDAALVLLGVVVSLAAVGIYLGWVWIRELDRISGHLDLWENRATVFGGPNRPVCLTLPAIVVLLGLSAFLAKPDQYGTAVRIPMELAWLVVPVVLLTCARWSDVRRMRFPEREDWAIATGLAVQGIGFWIAGLIGRLLPNASADDWVAGTFVPELVFSLVAIFVLTHLPDVVRYDAVHAGNLRQHASSVYLSGFGLVCIAVARLEGSDVATAIELVGWFCVVMAAILVVIRQLERH